jgi:LacI family transcriptional regulator
MSRLGRPTIRDVAALAGVSLNTVSRVVNGEPQVTEDLAARVRRAVAQLDYKPNLTASNLRRSGGRSATIGLLLEDMANPFSSSIYRAVENVANLRSVEVLAGSLEESAEREKELAARLFARRIDGLIIAPAGHDHSYLLTEQRAGAAVIFVDRPPELLAADSVVSNHVDGSVELVNHLIGLGHRKIAYMGYHLSIVTGEARYSGFVRAMQEANVPLDSAYICHGIQTMEEAYSATLAMFRGRRLPSAFFSAHYWITIGAIRALRELGLRQSVAVVGFDDFMTADLLEPPVTVVTQDAAAMGRLAAELLFRRVDGDSTPFEQQVLETELIVRGTLRPKS